MEKITHTFEPVCDPDSRILLLGTMPSPKSRENGFYYSHPRNRFWPVLAGLFRELPPSSAEEKRDFLRRRHIALWDVLHACVIEGASDQSIRDPVPNDIGALLRGTQIRAVFTTGGKAAALYRRYCEEGAGLPALPLPSTSPANAAMGLEELTEAYRVILQYL